MAFSFFLIGTDEFLSDASVAICENDAIANYFIGLSTVLTGSDVLSKRRNERVDTLTCRRNELLSYLRVLTTLSMWRLA